MLRLTESDQSRGRTRRFRWFARVAPAVLLAWSAGYLGPAVGDDRPPVVAQRPVPQGAVTHGAVTHGVVAKQGATERDSSAENPAARVDKPVTPEEKIKFEQDKAHAHMRELESRMYRVAELLRETQSDDSARLLMGVSKAREQLIVEQMREAAELVAVLDLNKATAEEKEVIAKLEDLKRLLLTSDLDLELKLAQLRKLREAQETLQRLTAREKQQLSQTQPLANQPKKDQKALDGLKHNEQRNQRSGQDLAQLVKRLGPQGAPSAGSISGACQCMGGAGNRLGSGQPKEAAGNQKEAIEKLSQASNSLKELEAKLKKEVEALARQRVIENLTKMIAQQKQVREATQRLVPRVAEKQRQAVLAVRQLAPLEENIAGLCRASIELVELTQFSVVLPSALGGIEEQIDTVAVSLRDGKADDETVTSEKRIESDLQALLEALKDAATMSSSKPCQCKGCKGDKNKLLAEVRILRLMEVGLNKDTRRVDRAKREKKVAVNEANSQTNDLGRRQLEIRKITSRLHAMTCPHCLEEGDAP